MYWRLSVHIFAFKGRKNYEWLSTSVQKKDISNVVAKSSYAGSEWNLETTKSAIDKSFIVFL